MKKLFTLMVAICAAVLCANAQSTAQDNGEIAKYRRSSLYSILISHPHHHYADEIREAFENIPMPDKFDDHNLNVRVIESTYHKMKQHGKKKDEMNLHDANEYILSSQVAKKLVSKWFNRGEMGGFDMSLIQDRGYYDASQVDIATALESTRQLTSLADAGEHLIGNTFMVVNDITYVDHGENSAKAAAGIAIVGSLVGSILGSSNITDLSKGVAKATNEIDGFTVNVTSYLYRLVWNDEVAGTFYNTYWTPNGNEDPERVLAYDTAELFHLDYIGESSASAASLESKSFSKKTKSQQMLSVCARAVDKSLVGLQREYDEFKVNVPIYSISSDKKTVQVQIGMKEGVDEKTEFEVLMPVEGEDGRISYNRVGTIKPVKGKIWDNRFGALEAARDLQAARIAGEKIDKKAASEISSIEVASLGATTFKVVTGGNRIIPGCLARELKKKK